MDLDSDNGFGNDHGKDVDEEDVFWDYILRPIPWQVKTDWRNFLEIFSCDDDFFCNMQSDQYRPQLSILQFELFPKLFRKLLVYLKGKNLLELHIWKIS